MTPRRARVSRHHVADFCAPGLRLVKFWSSSRDEWRRKATKRRTQEPLNGGKRRTMASAGDAFRVNRTQEVAGSSPASSTSKRPARRAFLFSGLATKNLR